MVKFNLVLPTGGSLPAILLASDDAVITAKSKDDSVFDSILKEMRHKPDELLNYLQTSGASHPSRQ